MDDVEPEVEEAGWMGLGAKVPSCGWRMRRLKQAFKPAGSRL
ncbi:MAG: hypothetical protein ACE5Z5_01570 [Candidatus Bathyarchaeia archaeon]